ncbi:MAG: EAL domain-containing protein [Deltaproteobacteria bacterium]|nr:EAL domain-containing protein [Deltaproteobacteria bacterium]
MGSADDSLAVADAQPRGSLIPGYGASLGPIGERFSAQGAMGLLLLDAASFAEIERLYGLKAHRQALGQLTDLIRETVGRRLAPQDLILQGGIGRNEILVILFRPCDQVDFHVEEIPALREALLIGLKRQGSRVAYPYVKEAPPIYLGTAVALRHPTFGIETQLRRALEHARADARLSLEIAKRERRHRFIKFILQGEISSVYEPIVEVSRKTVHGYEALARGPAGSEFHSPLAMFRTAEEEGLVFQLDCLCRQKALEGSLGRSRGTKLFVNIRPTTVQDPAFHPDVLSRTLDRYDLRPSDLVFEISEQESIDNFTIFREVRDDYGKLGFQFALDDTGAGYASLQSVIELSPEYIKVDRSLITGIDEDLSRQELLRALHAVAGQIRARIIAEGLNTLEELSTLAELGIPFGQGWLFGKPTPLRAGS